MHKIMKQYYFKFDGKSKLYFTYTILFMLLFCFIFSPFDLNGKSFAWGRDSFTVEYPARQLLCRRIIDFFQNPSRIPKFTFSIGQGLDVFGFLNTWYLEPVNVLMAFFPVSSGEISFTVICILYLYLSGISFLAYSFCLCRPGRKSVIGSLIYCFSGFALYYAPRHPCFLAPMVYMPLIFLSIENMIEKPKKNITSYTVIIFISLMSSYYYFYINTILSAFYIIVRLLINRNVIFKKKIMDLAFLAAGYIIGMGMAAVFFLPAIYFYINSNRTSGAFRIKDYLCYEFSAYIREFIYLIIPYVQDYKNWLILGITPVCVITFLFLFLKNNFFELKVLGISGLIIISFPLFGLIFAAFSSINSRYAYYVIFVFSLVFVAMYDFLYRPCLKIQTVVFLYTMIYFAICIFSDSINRYSAFVGLALMLLTVIAFLGAQNKHINIKIRQLMLDAVILITVAVGGYSLFDTNFTGYVSEFNDSGEINDKLLNSPLEAIAVMEDDSFFRVAEGKTDTFYLNSSISAQNYQGVNSISMMHNVIDHNMAEFNMLLGNNDYYDRTMIYGLDNRKILETLAGVDYYIASESQLCYVPDIYAFYGTYKDHYIFVRESEYSSGLGYLYSSIISHSEFEQLNMIERQETLLHSAVVDDSISGQDNFSNDNNRCWGKRAEYIMYNMTNQEIQRDSGYVISFPGETVYMDFHVPVKSDIYLQLSRPCTGGYSCTAILNGLEKNINFLEEKSMYDAGQNTYLVYMGCLEAGDYRMAVRCDSYTDEPVLTCENLEIYTESAYETNLYIKKTAEHQLQNIKMEADYISADINAEADSLLFLSIPYTEKGWKAKVDGRETDIIQTNIMYMGIPVSPGKHIIELTYTTPYLYAGIIISSVSFLLMLGFYIVNKIFSND